MANIINITPEFEPNNVQIPVSFADNILDNEAKGGGGGGGGLTQAIKTALLQLASKVAYIDANGAQYYQDLYDALYGSLTTYTVTNNLTYVYNSNAAVSAISGSMYYAALTTEAGYSISSVTVTMGGVDITSSVYNNGTIRIPSVSGNISITAVAAQTKTLDSISAVFTQGGATIYSTTPLDDLKQYLVVTATWDDTTTSVIPDNSYTLSGTLTVGTSTITASYGGESDTFSVTVSASQGDIFGVFTAGYAIGKKTKSSQGATTMAMYSIWNTSTSARAAMTTPIANNNYTLTSTDSSKYTLAVYGITDPTAQPTNYSNAVTGEYFQGDSASPSFAASGSTNASYLMVSLKKNDGTAFTAEELENGAAAVFTYSTT